jgi:hypothetical protein
MAKRTDFLFSFGRRPGKHLFRAVCLFSLLSAAPLFAQTVQPLIDENIVKAPGKVASGKIEYINDSLQTLSVVLEPRSFTVSDTGDLSYRALDEGIHVKFSTMSFRIPPKQNFLVFYEASADKLPSWFVVYATFGGFKERTQEGFRIQIQLPHTVYILPKQDVQKEDLIVRVAEYRPSEKKVVVRVENTGPSFGRVLETDVTSAKDKATQGGFPVFPHSQRQIEIPWDSVLEPSRLQLRLAHFKLEQGVANAAP